VDTHAYASREDVKRALDSKHTARDDAQIDRALEAGRYAVERCTNRVFFPWTGTRYFDWPNHQLARSWRLWLDSNELVSVSALTSGGTTISSSDYFLRRSDNRDEAPYTHIEIDLDSTAAFSAGDTHQRSVAITGVFGYTADQVSAGLLAEALDDSETGVDVTNSAAIGVGHIIKVDSERMIVTDKAMLDTLVDIDAGDSLTASTADVSITMSTTTGAPVKDEVILIDSERMLVVDVASTVLTVIRAWDGTTLATHAGSASIFAPRTLTVQRGALGTTAASHSTSTAVFRHAVPGLIRELTIAEALNTLLQETAGYGRPSGQGENSRTPGQGLQGLREQAYQAFGRKARKKAV
jgi:hypothetical protein